MFADPIYSAFLLTSPFFIYFLIIRPRLKTGLTKLYQNIDSFWAWVWRLIVAFRTFVVASIGAILTALPDLLVIISPLDFSPFLPQPWPAYTGPATAIIITLMRAFDTKPRETK